MKVMFCLLILFSGFACKKETSSFSAAGYWRGTLQNVRTDILNREDGSSRLYAHIRSSDTSDPALKYEGKYTVTGEVFRAVYSQAGDTFSLVSTRTTPNTITGIVTLHTAGVATVFEFVKD